SETATDFGDFIEKAETKAIGRALNALGYGAQFTEPGDDEPAGEGRPAATARRDVAPRAAAAPATSPSAEAAAPPPSSAATPERRAAPIEIGNARARAASAAPRPAPSTGDD